MEPTELAIPPTAGEAHPADTRGDGLVRRVRWLFWSMLVFVSLASAATTLDEPDLGLGVVATIFGASAFVVAWGTLLLRRADLHPVIDVVPLLAGLAVGLVGHSTRLFGLAFAMILFRAMSSSRRVSLAFGAGSFAIYQAAVVHEQGPAELVGIDPVVMLATFLAFAWVMQSLGEAARDNETLVRRERVLAVTSAQLIAATTSEPVADIAVEGLRALTDEGTDAAVWFQRVGRDLSHRIFTLVASAGPRAAEHGELDADGLHGGVRELLTGRTARRLSGAEAVDALATLWPGRAAGLRSLIVAPITHGGRSGGFLVIAAPGDLSEQLVGVLGRFANEVSLALDRARLVEKLEVTNRDLLEADQVKDRFLSTVSHELRTPLTGIRGFADVVRRRVHDLDPQELERYLGVIDRNAGTLQRLVEDLLVTTRSIAGRLPASPEPVDAALTAYDVVETLNLLDDCTFDIAESAEDRTAHVDPHQLRQIVTNLLSNAIKYGRPPYVVQIRRAESRIRLVVRDHGDGVPAEFRPHLFERFAQADRGDSGTARGVGLGLSIVRDIVELNGGTIHHEPAGGGGASFVVELPRASAEPSDPGTGSPVDASLVGVADGGGDEGTGRVTR